MATDNLWQVLEGYEQERIQLGVNFLNQALVAATLNDNLECIGKLIKMGAKSIDECIQLATEKKVKNATAVLLLQKAALTGDKSLFTNPSSSPEFHDVTYLVKLRIFELVLRGRMSTVDPLEVAQQTGQHLVRRKLLMMTGVNELDGHVNWSNLHITNLDKQLLETMYSWLRRFNLSSNKLRRIPVEIKMLSEVRKEILYYINKVANLTAYLTGC